MPAVDDGIEVSTGIGSMIVAVVAALGGDAARLVAETGFDPGWGSDPERRIPLALETALWERAAELCGDPLFGVHAAERFKPGGLGVFDYALRTAPTLRASLERLSRYNRLVHDAAVITVIERGERLRVEHSLGAVGQSRHAAEFTLAGIVVVGGQLAGVPLTARAVEFRHVAPSAGVVAEHARFFGCEPLYAMPANALELDRSLSERPLVTADPALSRIVEQHAEALLAARPEPVASTSQRVRALLSRLLCDGEGNASLAAVARRLRLSERSLQRRLADENLSFDGLLEEVRRDLALRYLADRKIAIGEVAYLLGYSEPSAFNRAFKRWTGKTPSQARAG